MEEPSLAKAIGAIFAHYSEAGEVVGVVPVLYGFRLGIGDETGWRDLW